ncbi:hypothetical protein GCM10028799_29650 [Kribbella italica]
MAGMLPVVSRVTAWRVAVVLAGSRMERIDMLLLPDVRTCRTGCPHGLVLTRGTPPRWRVAVQLAGACRWLS